MAQPSKGPYTVEDRVERLLIWADGAHDFIAQLSTVADGADEAGQEAWEAEQQANAAAFGANPELIEVARQVIRVLRSNPSAVYGGVALLIEARCALKKAGVDEEG